MDEFLKDIANEDQTAAGLMEWAKYVRQFYDELLRRGFIEVDAMAILLNWQTAMIQSHFRRRGSREDGA